MNQPQLTDQPGEVVRFSARFVRAHPQRLGLSAQNLARLIGVSLMTVYNWGNGKIPPKNDWLAAFAGLRTVGKRAALKKLE